MNLRNHQTNGRRAAILWVLAFGAALMSVAAADWSSSSFQEQVAVYKELPPPGKKCPLNDGFYFTYELSEKPKIGTIILKVRVFDSEGEKTASLVITGRYDMPAMSGAHDSGDQEFKLNKNNDYLLPITVVMRGEWEVKLTFVKDGTPVFRGFFRFNV